MVELYLLEDPSRGNWLQKVTMAQQLLPNPIFLEVASR